jgi:hypothetical protein
VRCKRPVATSVAGLCMFCAAVALPGHVEPAARSVQFAPSRHERLGLPHTERTAPQYVSAPTFIYTTTSDPVVTAFRMGWPRHAGSRDPERTDEPHVPEHEVGAGRLQLLNESIIVTGAAVTAEAADRAAVAGASAAPFMNRAERRAAKHPRRRGQTKQRRRQRAGTRPRHSRPDACSSHDTPDQAPIRPATSVALPACRERRRRRPRRTVAASVAGRRGEFDEKQAQRYLTGAGRGPCLLVHP